MTSRTTRKNKWRWVLRVLIYPVLIIGAASLLLHSPLFKRYLFHQFNSYLDEKYEIQVVVREWNFSLFQGSASADDLFFVSRHGGFFCRVPKIQLFLSPRDLIRGRITPRRLFVQGIELVLALPSPDKIFQSGKSQGNLDLKFNRIDIRQGKILIREMEIPLDLLAEGIHFTVNRASSSRTQHFSLELTRATVKLQSRLLEVNAFAVRGSLRDDHVEFTSASLTTPFLHLTGRGSLDLSGDIPYSCVGKADLDLSSAQHLAGQLPVSLGGKAGLFFQAQGRGKGGALPVVSGRLNATDLRVNDLKIRQLSAQLTTREEVYHVENIILSLPHDGLLRGQAAFYPDRPRVVFSGQIAGVPLGMLSEGHILSFPVTGTLDGDFKGEVPLDGKPKFSLEGQIAQLSVPLPKRDEFYQGEYIRAGMSLQEGVLQFHVDSALGEGLLLDGQGEYKQGELSIPRLHILVPAREEARNLLDRVARLSPRLSEKLSFLEINGRTEFIGSLHLRGTFPDIEGTLDAQEVRLNKIPWDSVHFPFMLNSERLRVTQALLRRGETRLKTDFDLRIDPDTHLDSIDLNVTSLDLSVLENVLSFIGLGFGEFQPSQVASAFLSGNFSLQSPAGRPWQGSFQLGLNRLTHGGEMLGSARVNGSIAGNVIQIQEIALQGKDMEATAAGSWNFETDRLVLKAAVRKFDLQRLPESREYNVKGILSGEIDLSGQLKNPAVAADLRSEKIVFYDEPFGNLRLLGRLEDGTINYSLRTEYRNNLYNAMGSLTLGPNPTLQSTLFLNNLQVQPFLKQFRVPAADEIRGALSGEMVFTYPLKNPEGLEVSGRFTDLNLEYKHLKLKNTQPFFLAVENRKLSLNDAILRLNEDPLVLQGDVTLFPLSRLHFSINGTTRLDLLQPFYPEVQPAGQVQLQCFIQGEPTNPDLSGRIEFTDASLKMKSPELFLKKINGALDLTRRSMKTDRLEFDSSYGKMSLSGECVLDHLQPSRWSVSLSSEKLLLPFPDEFITEATMALRFNGNPQNSMLGGDVWIVKSAPMGNIDLLDFVSILSRIDFSGSTAAEGPSWRDGLRLNLSLRGDRSLTIDTDTMNVIGSLGLQVVGTLDQPVIRGNLIVNSGEVKFKLHRFQVDRGLVSFINPAEVDPQIQLQLSSDIKDYHVGIVFEGILSRLKTRFTSVPSLPVADIVRLITTGELPSLTTGRTQRDFENADTTAILSQLLSATMEKRLKRVIGFDTFSLDTYSTSAESSPKARVTVGKQISRDLFITYSKSVSSQEQDLIFIEYRISPRWTVVASSDEKGYFGLDFRYRKKLR